MNRNTDTSTRTYQYKRGPYKKRKKASVTTVVIRQSNDGVRYFVEHCDKCLQSEVDVPVMIFDAIVCVGGCFAFLQLLGWILFI